MQTRRNIERADRIIKSFSARDVKALQRICVRIQKAQQRLIRNAGSYFDVCLRQCKGLCCRNIHVSSIVTSLDFVFILGLDRSIYPRILKAAKQEGLYSADCLFLQNRVGPCMFPDTIKPERCIVTFCQDSRPLRSEIKAIRSGFSRLYRFVVFRRPLVWYGF